MPLSYGTTELHIESLEIYRGRKCGAGAANQKYQNSSGLDSSSNMDCGPHGALDWLDRGADIPWYDGEEGGHNKARRSP